MRNHKEAVEYAEGQRWHGEEVHGGDGFTMVAQKGRPSLYRLRTPLHSMHPTQHSSFGDIETEHFQFAMNPRRSPGSVLSDHAENDLSQFPADAFSSCAGPVPREPGPIQLESGPVPSDNGFRLDQNQGALPPAPEPPQHHPQQFLSSNQSRLGMLPFQDCELLPKSQVFQEQVVATPIRIEQTGQPEASAGVAYSQFHTMTDLKERTIYLPDSTTDPYFGEPCSNLRVADNLDHR
jgi:hypothetical protein